MLTSDAQRILDFWFAEAIRDTLNVDSRMERWFDANETLDAAIRTHFAALTELAIGGELADWAETPEGALALILLLDQFPRRLYPGTQKSFAGDQRALQLVKRGIADASCKQLSPEQQMFFFMPLQRSESLKMQNNSVKVYNALATVVSNSRKETFLTVAQFAELRRDIIEQFGRFPHRNGLLGRRNSGSEQLYLDDGLTTNSA